MMTNEESNQFMDIYGVMRLAYKMNISTDYCVFVHYSGHVNQLQVIVAKSKDEFDKWIYESVVYLNEKDTDEKLMKCIATLSRLLTKKDKKVV